MEGERLQWVDSGRSALPILTAAPRYQQRFAIANGRLSSTHRVNLVVELLGGILITLPTILVGVVD